MRCGLAASMAAALMCEGWAGSFGGGEESRRFLLLRCSAIVDGCGEDFCCNRGVNVLCRKRLLSILGLAGAYYLTALLGLSLALPQTNATAVWISSGIALAALLRWGEGLWPGVALGAFLANAHVLWLTRTGSPGAVLLTASVIAMGNT